MPRFFLDISMSLDGFVAGPNATLEEPLGDGRRTPARLGASPGELALDARPRRGETGPDDDLVRATRERVGAEIMGRRMFSGGEGAWEDDPNADAWWGDNPPFHHPVFVLTHHSARNRGQGRRDDVLLRQRRHRERARAGARRGRRTKTSRSAAARSVRAAVPDAQGSWTSSTSTSLRSCSAAASASSASSAPMRLR